MVMVALRDWLRQPSNPGKSMHPGAVISRAGRLYAVLASGDRAVAVVPLALTDRRRHGGDVEVVIAPLGRVTAMCASASIERGVWSATGLSLAATDLAACVAAAARAKQEEALHCMPFGGRLSAKA